MRVMPLALLAALQAAVPARSHGQVPADSARRDAIRQLLRIQRTDSQLLVGMDLAFEQAGADPSLPAGFMDSVRVRARRNVGRFVERLVPVYDSLFTADEIAQLTVFFRSPIGQRLVDAQPAIAAAAGDIGQRWGMELAAEVMLELSRQPGRRP